MGSNVYVSQRSDLFDYSSALNYGKVYSVLLDENDSADEEILGRRLRQFRSEYDPGRDYVVLTGHPISMAMVAASAFEVASKMQQPVKFLIFNKSIKIYDQVRSVHSNLIYRDLQS